MTEEVKVETVVEAPEYNEVEQAAIEKGWRPKEEYAGDPSKWRSAETFLALDEPLKRIEHQSKEMKQLRAALEAFREHHTKVEASAFDRALKSLQADRKQAMLDGDTVKALELEEQVDQVKDQRQRLVNEASKPIVQDVPQVNPEFLDWQNKNSWYASNKAMTAVADAYGKELHEQGYTPSQVLRKVEERVKEEFPHKFKNENTQRPMAVEPSSRGASKSSNVDVQMNQQELDIMRKIVKSGVMTEAEYKAELKKVKE